MANQTAATQQPKVNQPAKPTPAKEKAPVKSKAERFKDLAPKRTRNVLRHLEFLGNCSNTGGYEYTQENIEKIFTTIEKKVAEVKAKFKPKAPGEKAGVTFEL